MRPVIRRRWPVSSNMDSHIARRILNKGMAAGWATSTHLWALRILSLQTNFFPLYMARWKNTLVRLWSFFFFYFSNFFLLIFSWFFFLFSLFSAQVCLLFHFFSPLVSFIPTFHIVYFLLHYFFLNLFFSFHFCNHYSQQLYCIRISSSAKFCICV